MTPFTKTTAALLAISLSVSLSACASNNYSATSAPSSATIYAAPAIKTMQSDYSFDDTRRRIKDKLRDEKFTIFESIDHAAGARKAGLTLSPSTLYIFGNPKGGTPIMQADPRMGIELPLKMHVYQTGETVNLSYIYIQAAAQDYGIEPTMQPLPKIADKLDMMAAKITQ